ncbi:hydrolase [uncultured Acinetobacter sp.]|uniref:hydrolase n=1 Tax=uncultured Acinetobacter sp. TaxID=165433 RepID=UPI00258FB4BE|nr:hydrolase [uncultured Acinetobacter sp.]
MPITPLHLGIGCCCKAIGQQRFSMMIFAGTQVLMDMEPLLGLIYGWQYLHLYTHNLMGATLIGSIALLIGKPISEWGLSIISHRKWSISWKTTAISAYIGSFSHILLDAFMHHDVYLFYPWILQNPLLGLISYSIIFYGCVFSAILGSLCWFIILKLKKKGV